LVGLPKEAIKIEGYSSEFKATGYDKRMGGADLVGTKPRSQKASCLKLMDEGQKSRRPVHTEKRCLEAMVICNFGLLVSNNTRVLSMNNSPLCNEFSYYNKSPFVLDSYYVPCV
jgi:hypothetical protein